MGDSPALYPECEKCLLCYQDIKHPGLGGRGNIDDPLLVGIGEAPGPDEDLEGSIFIGKAGKELDFLLGDKMPRIYLTNALKCLPLQRFDDPSQGFRTPEALEIFSCRSLLFKELRAFDPNKVALMPMGAIAYQSLFGFPPDPGILAVAGLPVRLKINDSEFLVVPNVHPSWVARAPKEREGKFLGVLNRAWNFAKEGNLSSLDINNKGAEYKILDPQQAILELEFILANKENLKNIILDLETTSLDYWKAEIIMVNFAHSFDPKGFSIPLRVSNVNHHPEKYPYEVPLIEWDINFEQVCKIRELVVKIIESIPLVGHNLKYDLLCLLWNKWIENLDKVRVFDDTMILLHLIYNQRLGNLRLKDCCKKIFDIKEDWDKKVTSYLDLFHLKKDKINYANLPTFILGEYGALDAYYNRKLHDHLIESFPQDLEHLREFITYLTIVFTESEISGIALDKDVHKFLGDSYGEMLDKMSEKALSFHAVKEYIGAKIGSLREENEKPKKKKRLTEEEMVAEVFTMTKRLALIDVMFGKDYLDMPVLKRTKGGKDRTNRVPATDQEAVDLLKLHPKLNEDQRIFIDNLADYRTIDKLKSTYVDPVMDRYVNDLYRQEFMIPGTITGRLSSGFHTLPRDSDIKRMYCSRWRDQGGMILGFDFSQLELRVLACLSNETKMIEAFKNKVDIHAITGGEIAGKSWDKITSEERATGKTTNFAIIYGKTSDTLKDDLHVSRDRAQQVIDSVLGGYDKVSTWMAARHKELEEIGGIKTIFGREIPILEYYLDGRNFQLEAQRKSVNYPIQSAASDLVNSGIVRLHKKFKLLQLKSIILAAIHDAAYNDLKPGELFILIALMKKILEIETMMMYSWLICPIEIDISMGTSMGGSVKMEVEELEENRALLNGKGLRRDFNMLMFKGENSYNMKFYLEKEREVDKDYFTIDRVLGDTVEWKGRLEITQK